MSMTVGELFVNLGVKGADKSVQAVQGVRKGMGEVASSSLAAKAGILAVLYGFERLVQGSNQTGNSLMQFAAYTGLSMDRLQRWQYLLRQSGVDASEAQGSMEGLQKVMYQISHGLSGTAGMKYISEVLGKAGKDIDWKKAGTDTDYMMGKMREFLQLSKDIPRANQAASEMGLTKGTTLAFRTSNVNLDKIPKGLLISDKEAASTQKMGVAWANMGFQVERAMGHLNAQFGPKLIKDLQGILPTIIHVAEAFAKLADKIQVIEGIGKIFEGWGVIFETISSVIDKVTGNKDGLGAGLMKEGGSIAGGAIDIAKTLGSGLLNEMHTKYREAHLQYDNSKKGDTNVVINAHGVKDAHELPQIMQKSIDHAHRTSPVHKGGI